MLVLAVMVACGDDDSSDFATRPSGDSSSACEDCDGSSSSKAKSSSSATSSSSSLVGRIPCDINTDEDCFKDERDGQTYRTVKIGTQTWMAENLNYAYIGVPFNYDGYTSDSTSWCYGDSLANCTKYGRLYTWAAAMDSAGIIPGNSANGCGYGKYCNLGEGKVRGVCPEGWRLPDTTEWSALFNAVGRKATAGLMLKSTEGWNYNGNGSDSYFFSALPAGDRNGNGDFDFEGYYANFWSSTESNSDYAYDMNLNYYDVDASLYDVSKYLGFSVRCLMD